MNQQVQEAFYFDTRLGTMVLRSDLNWVALSEEVRAKILGQWALYCASMTGMVADIEVEIMQKLDAMYEANTEDEMHRLNNEMMELASVVCDLNILSRSVYTDLLKVHF